MRVNDAVIGVVLVAFAAAMMAYSLTFPSMPGQRFGPALFPVVIGVGMTLCGVIFIVYGLARLRAEGWAGGADWLRSPHHLGNLAALVLALIVYILFSDRVGFIPMAALISAALMVKLRRGHVLSSIAIAIAATLVVYWVFARMLLVPLPLGLLTRVLY